MPVRTNHRAWPPSQGWGQLSSFLCFPPVFLWAQEIHGVPIHSSARKASAPCPEVYPPSVKVDSPPRAAGFLGSTRKEGKEHLVPHTVSASKIYPRNRHGRHSGMLCPLGDAFTRTTTPPPLLPFSDLGSCGSQWSFPQVQNSINLPPTQHPWSVSFVPILRGTQKSRPQRYSLVRQCLRTWHGQQCYSE